MQLELGDSLEVLTSLEDNSIDSVVTDPPYGLKFMAKKWDADVPTIELWKQVFRVLKPGGYLLSFGGTRTYHRLVVNIEDAGFEIRDQIQWLYGSGFSKSHNVSKGIDKLAGAEREVIGRYEFPDGAQRVTDRTRSERVRQLHGSKHTPIEAPSTPEAEQWDGWGTALKPANEPICLARKPLSEKTVAKNVLKWGTGAINIDACRIGFDKSYGAGGGNKTGSGTNKSSDISMGGGLVTKQHTQGRWPANILLDETAADMLDEQSGVSASNVRPPTGKPKYTGSDKNSNAMMASKTLDTTARGHVDKGGASRFFYCAKASKRERNAGLEGMPRIKGGSMSGGEETRPDRPTNHPYNQNHHPTVKPIKLMQYLVTLITPPNGTVLDPFMGSGTTGIAAKNLGFKFIGIEREEEYLEIARRRIDNSEVML